jgi:hypothetical protein
MSKCSREKEQFDFGIPKVMTHSYNQTVRLKNRAFWTKREESARGLRPIYNGTLMNTKSHKYLNSLTLY